jgi:hypothetical protein
LCPFHESLDGKDLYVDSVWSSLRSAWMMTPYDEQLNVQTMPRYRLTQGILLLTIYPEIKRDVVSCLDVNVNQEQFPNHRKLT